MVKTPGKDWKGLTITTDYRDLLADKQVDAVLIATPDHWHGEPTILAARAKKHRLLREPISLTIREGRAMAEEVKKNKVVFQTGSQQRTEYGGKFRRTVEMIRSGAIGELKKVRVCVGGPPVSCDLPSEPVPQESIGMPGSALLRFAGTTRFFAPTTRHNHFPPGDGIVNTATADLPIWERTASTLDSGRWMRTTPDPSKSSPPRKAPVNSR